MNLRPPTFDDAEAILHLLIARDIADLGRPDVALADILEDWRRDGVDRARDAVVGEVEGEVVAYAIAKQAPSLAVVAVQGEGRGFGTQLLEWLEARERELGWEHHRQGVGERNRAAQELLTAHGYGIERQYFRMRRELEALVAPPEPPAGVRLRPVDPEADAGALHALDDASFASVPDYRPHALAEFRAGHLEVPDRDPDASLIAEHQGTAVAALLARRWEEESTGYVDILAVHPDWQGRGLGTLLLQLAWSRFREAGLRGGELAVASDNPPALALYRKLGMRPRFTVNAYAKPVQP